MHATVTRRTDDGREHVLGHGDLIGRVWSAALCLDDARVSEAHAMVSLRGAELRMLALRGMLALGGTLLREVTLEPGQRVALARGVGLDVLAVQVPERVMALRLGAAAPTPLAGVCSLMPGATPTLRAGVRQGARAVFHLAADGWQVRVGDSVSPLQPGWTLPGVDVEAVWLRPTGAGQATRALDQLDAPLRLVLRYDTVLSHRSGEPILRLTGRAARLVSELGSIGAPVHWEPLARQVWTDDIDTPALRRRFDMMLSRIRRKLSDAGVTPDLVRSDRSGLFELVLRPQDTVVDES